MSKITKTFLDFPNAAKAAGFSIRHFRRIVEEEHIPIIEINSKFFILSRDLQPYLDKRELQNGKQCSQAQ